MEGNIMRPENDLLRVVRMLNIKFRPGCTARCAALENNSNLAIM